MNRQVTTCLLDATRRYRYLLQVQLGDGPALAVIQKNPSRADAMRADPTVGKVEAWARRQGFGTVTYLNLFAYRSPEPELLNGLSYAEAVGMENDVVLRRALRTAEVTVAAWGNPNGINPARYEQRIAEVLTLCTTDGYVLQTVGTRTQLGYPRHGLHWNGPLPLYRSS